MTRDTGTEEALFKGHSVQPGKREGDLKKKKKKKERDSNRERERDEKKERLALLNVREGGDHI